MPHQSEINTEHLCNICEKSFSKKSNLTRHTKQFHIETSSFKHANCDRNLNTSSDLKNHRAEVTFQRCSESFNEERTMVKHKHAHTGIDPVQSFNPNCDRYLNTSSDLQHHRPQVTFQCGVCSESFNEERAMVNHKEVHIWADPIQSFNLNCDSTSSDLQHHCPQVTFQCGVCSESFSEERTMLNHKQVHTETDPVQSFNALKRSRKKPSQCEISAEYQCNICGTSYTRKSNLMRHVKHYHIETSSSKLPNCHRNVNTSSDLKSHCLQVTFQCDVCSEFFYGEKKMVNHKQIHTGIKPIQKSRTTPKDSVEKCDIRTEYLCNICKRSFCRKFNLIRHVRQFHLETSSLQRPNFNTSSDLNNHLPQVLFQSEICSDSFDKERKLVKHKWVHIGITPIQCRMCKEYFNCQNDLRKHLESHYGEKPNKCKKLCMVNSNLTDDKTTEIRMLRVEGSCVMNYQLSECSSEFHIKQKDPETEIITDKVNYTSAELSAENIKNEICGMELLTEITFQEENCNLNGQTTELGRYIKKVNDLLRDDVNCKLTNEIIIKKEIFEKDLLTEMGFEEDIGNLNGPPSKHSLEINIKKELSEMIFEEESFDVNGQPIEHSSEITIKNEICEEAELTNQITELCSEIQIKKEYSENKNN